MRIGNCTLDKYGDCPEHGTTCPSVAQAEPTTRLNIAIQRIADLVAENTRLIRILTQKEELITKLQGRPTCPECSEESQPKPR